MSIPSSEVADAARTDGVRLRGDEAASAPPDEYLYRRRLRPVAAMRELWASREMVRSLAERELRARYKQTFLGFAWAIITPVTLMLVFTVLFRRVATVETHGVPYALFAYMGLLPWGFFSTAISQGGISLIVNAPLLNKVYCPREVFPLASVSVAVIDTVIAASALLVLFAINGFVPRIETLWLPVLWVVQIAYTLGVVLILSSVVVYFRDLKATLPLILQLGLFATPVAYGLAEVPRSFRALYVVLNPQAAVIDSSRRAVLRGLPPDWDMVGLAAASALVVLVAGYLLFKRLETGISDVA